MKKDLRVIKTKSSLHEALVRLLQEKTLDTITISQLCKEAKVNRGTFYLHYTDIPSLFEEYFKDITEDLKEAYYKPYILTKNNIKEINAEMVRIFHHVEKYKQFYKIVFNRNTPMMYYYRLFDIIQSYMKVSIESRMVENNEYFASYFANAIIGMIILWARDDFKTSPTELNDLLLSITRVKL